MFGPGERFVDLGCGDGRVLVAAARRGAVVRGLEIDEQLAELARQNLRNAGLAGTVDVCDMFREPLDADVAYAYLTPVTLVRLVPQFLALRPGGRVVTPVYGVAGWAPEQTANRCNLFAIPPNLAAPPVEFGWQWRATLLVAPAMRRGLLPLSCFVREGPIELEVDGQLSRHARVAVGSERADGPAQVPVDVIFEARAAGTVIAGDIRAQGYTTTVAVVFADTGVGQWNFAASEGARFARMLDEKRALVRNGHAGEPSD